MLKATFQLLKPGVRFDYCALNLCLHFLCTSLLDGYILFYVCLKARVICLKGRAILMAPRRQGTFHDFARLSQSLMDCEIIENYDSYIWELHTKVGCPIFLVRIFLVSDDETLARA